MSTLKTYITSSKKQIDFDEFNDEFKKSDIALIFLMAPWCGHCKRLLANLKPVVKKISGMKSKNKIVIGAFHGHPSDPSEGEDEFQKLNSNINTNINGFPTIQLYKKGIFVKNLGDVLDRSEEGLESYIKSLLISDKSTPTGSRKKRKYRKRLKGLTKKLIKKKKKTKKKWKRLSKYMKRKSKKKTKKGKKKNKGKKRNKRLRDLLSF